jgi:hypothetical protein
MTGFGQARPVSKGSELRASCSLLIGRKLCSKTLNVEIVTSCGPIDSEICGEQGAVISAAAYLDAHYQLDPSKCNTQVAIPWVWLARFAAELTLQSATKALYASRGALQEWPECNRHVLGDLHSQWSDAAQKCLDTRPKIQRFQSKADINSSLFGPLDAADPNGLMLRYPVPHPKHKDVSPIPNGFDEHCEWPYRLRQLIVRVCDLTIEVLPESRASCRNAFKFLRCTAAAGYCLGNYDGTIELPSHEWPYSEHLLTPYKSIPSQSRSPLFVDTKWYFPDDGSTPLRLTGEIHW